MTVTGENQAIEEQPQSSRVALEGGADPYLQVAGFLFLFLAAGWAFLFFRWVSFAAVDWTPLAVELFLAEGPAPVAYLVYGIFFAVDLVVGLALIRGMQWARKTGIATAGLAIVISLVYFYTTRDFYGAITLFGLAGFLMVLLMRQAPWSLAYMSAFWLIIFFILPMVIVLLVSLGERSFRGTVVYPEFSPANMGLYFDDYARFFGRINGEFIYLRILGRSLRLAFLNTLICLLIGYPFAYWIAKQPRTRRPILIFLVMIPFWTNFLVRTYAWMLILRDSGLINTFWTGGLHEWTVSLAETAPIFNRLAAATEETLPLMFNQPAVFLGLFYGYLPFMVLPLYTNLEKLDWSLLEAAADLGANTWQRTVRVLIPLTLPGIIAGSIIVFIPSLGAYITPDLLGGARVMMLGNLIQQQFMTSRDWPFGSAIGFIMIGMMMLAIIVYFRVQARAENPV